MLLENLQSNFSVPIMTEINIYPGYSCFNTDENSLSWGRKRWENWEEAELVRQANKQNIPEIWAQKGLIKAQNSHATHSIFERESVSRLGKARYLRCSTNIIRESAEFRAIHT